MAIVSTSGERLSCAQEASVPTQSPQRLIAGMTRREWKNVLVAQLGSLVEFYEFQVFGFFTVVLGSVFFSPHGPEWTRDVQAFGIFTLGFMIRPLGGMVIGHFGDRLGRKKLFVFTILLMSFATLGIGVLPSYAAIGPAATVLLLILRSLQGISAGGEAPGAGTFVSEHVPGNRAGLASGVLYSGNLIGICLGGLIGALVMNFMPADRIESYGWRIPFIIGGLLGILILFTRRTLDETPEYTAARAAGKVPRAPLLEVLQTHKLAMVLVAVNIGWFSVAQTTINFYLPTYMQRALGVSASETSVIVTVGLMFWALSAIAWGWLGDKIGLANVMSIGAVAIGVLSFCFLQNIETIVHDPAWLTGAYIALNSAMGCIGVIPVLSGLPFPPRVRFSGYAFSYGIGAALFAGVTPTMIAYLTQIHGLPVVTWFVVGACALGLLAGQVTARIPLYERQPRVNSQHLTQLPDEGDSHAHR
jgi:MFS family permease